MINLLIIADDFTGALDAGVQFAGSGVKTLVTTNDTYVFSKESGPDVLVMDSETRHKSPGNAYETVYQIVKQAKSAGIPYIFKKTDSALRGNIGSELEAILDATEEEDLPFLPAYPQMNRTTKNGIQYIDGTPVKESVFGKDPFDPVSDSYIPDIIRRQSKVRVDTKKIEEDFPQSSGKRITVYDIETDVQLYHTALKLHDKGALTLMAGCAGVAGVLPDILDLTGKKPEFPVLEKPFMVVCGSVNPITKAQLDYGESHGFTRVRLKPEEKLDLRYWALEEGELNLQALVKKIRGKDQFLLDTNDLEGTNETISYAETMGLGIQQVRQSISTVLGHVAGRLMKENVCKTMLLTGGDTLLGFMNQMNVKELKPIGELDVGTVLSRFEMEGKEYHVITKSGGFGSEDLFTKLADKMEKEREIQMFTNYMLRMPKNIYSGSHARSNIPAILGTGVKKVAVFTDDGIKKAGLLDGLLTQIKECKKDFVVIETILGEPTYEQAQEAVDWFIESQADFIIAIGGGSVMDLAKLASVLSKGDIKVKDLLDHPSLAKKEVKTLMIPTTAGTGAEATPNSIVSVPEKELKVGIVNEEMIADYVILDAQMIKDLPMKIAAETGIDALAHAIECYTSKKANPFSDLFALEALELIFNSIESACKDQEAMGAKNDMLLAAFYAGVAITASGTTAVHALSYPLGGKYHIPHGVSNAMLLGPVMKFNEPECRELFAKVYDRVVKEGTLKKEEEKSKWILNRMTEIIKNLKIPSNLKEYGVSKEDLESLVDSGMEVQRLLVNNRRTLLREDARKLYQEIL